MARGCGTLTVIDISPTLKMYARTDMAFARAYYHWFLFIQPAPLPEKMVAAVGLQGIFGRMSAATGGSQQAFAPAARCRSTDAASLRR